MATRDPSPLAKCPAPEPRAKYLPRPKSGVHPIASVVTALHAASPDRDAERVGRGLRSQPRADARVRAAVALDAAIRQSGDTNLSVAAALDYTHEKAIRELRDGHKPLEVGHLLMLPGPMRAALAAAIVEANADDADLARTVFLQWFTASAWERAEAARDAAAIVVGGVPSDEHGEGGL